MLFTRVNVIFENLKALKIKLRIILYSVYICMYVTINKLRDGQGLRAPSNIMLSDLMVCKFIKVVLVVEVR